MAKWKAIGTHPKNTDVLIVDLDGRINIGRYIKHILPYSDFVWYWDIRGVFRDINYQPQAWCKLPIFKGEINNGGMEEIHGKC